MKKKLIALFVICFMLLSLVGCGKSYQEATETHGGNVGNGYFTTIKEWRDSSSNYYIVYANDTKVMYFVSWSAYKFGITPLYNTDGTLQIYDGK